MPKPVIQKSVLLDPVLYAQVQGQAKAKGISVAEAIRDALRRWVLLQEGEPRCN